MQYFVLTVLLSTVLVFLASSAPAADRVDALPGWSKPLPSRWYSGFLSFKGKHLHYVLVEAEQNRSIAPLVLWLNGGPGCSSMDGLLYEHGPLLVSSTGALVRNHHSWSHVAHILYLESPVGVGFSYQDSDVEPPITDELAAEDNLQALKVFFQLFPEHKDRVFYLAGESYAGVFIPMLAHKLMEEAQDWHGPIPGFLIGNPLLSWTHMLSSRFPYLAGHGAISPRVIAACPKPSSSCNFERATAVDLPRLNVYDIYRDCAGQSSSLFSSPAEAADVMIETIRAPRPSHPALMEMFAPACLTETAAVDWLKTHGVREALHIPRNLSDWEICSHINYWRNFNYDGAELISRLMHNYKILIYDGDTDSLCNYISVSNSLDALGLAVDQDMDWIPWSVSDTNGPQLAGFLTKYITPKGMFFATVKGSGHMVPQWRPLQALELFSRFIFNRSLRDGSDLPHARWTRVIM